VAITLCAAGASAVVVPFTETFESSTAAWSSAAAFTPLSYTGSGGPDGSGFGSTPVPFSAFTPFAQPLIFRGQGNFNSSGNAMFGDWIAAGVTTFSFSVRHNAPEPIDFFARFTPAFGAGVVGLTQGPVQPNVWTTLSVAINASNPNLIYEGTAFPVFGNINRTQVGILVPPSLAGNPGSFTFDIDNVSVTPAPGAAGLLAIGAIAAGRRRR
ncbi:MAG: hypothetical protein ACOYN0_00975, partial [Phycisphaerales bacterium]